MGIKIFGYAPSSISDSGATVTRDIPAFQISGMSTSFGALAICMYYYSGSEWVPYQG